MCKICKRQKNTVETGRGVGYCWECGQRVKSQSWSEMEVKRLLGKQVKIPYGE